MTIPTLSQITPKVRELCQDPAGRLAVIAAVVFYLRKQNVMGGAMRALPDFQVILSHQLSERNAAAATFRRMYGQVTPHLALTAVAQTNGLIALLVHDLTPLEAECPEPDELVAAWLFLFLHRETRAIDSNWPDLALAGLSSIPDDVRGTLSKAHTLLL